MIQPKVKITDINGQDFGIKNVLGVFWDANGVIIGIEVYFGNKTIFIDHNKNGIFTNPKGNLKCEFV